MKTKHTPEPWQFQKGFNNIYESNSGITTAIAKMSDHQVSGGHSEAEANGLRIVACVNALAGLNPDGVGFAVEALRLSEIALGDERIGTYEMDSPDWYGKVSKARTAVRDALNELEGTK